MNDLMRFYEQQAILDDLKSKEIPPEDEDAPDTFERLDSVVARVLASLKPSAGNDDRTK
jgi:hypothetical protein